MSRQSSARGSELSDSDKPISFSDRSRKPIAYEDVAFNPPKSKLPDFPSSVSKKIVAEESSPRTRSTTPNSNRGDVSEYSKYDIGRNIDPGVPNLNRRPKSKREKTSDSDSDTDLQVSQRHGSVSQDSRSIASKFDNEDLDLQFDNDHMIELHTLKDAIHENLIQLSTNCKRYRQQFDREINLSRKNLEESLVESFIDMAKHKLPDVYLRSIPKFGANEVSDALFRTLVAMKKDEQNLIKVRFDQDIIDDISKIIQDNIIEVFNYPISIFSKLLSSIKHHMDQIINHSDQMEILLVNFKGKNEELEQEVKHLKRVLGDRVEEEEQLKEELHDKDIQMDIMKQQIKRRDEQLDEQRSTFHKELTQVKMKLYEKEELGKTIASDDIPVGDFTVKFLQGDGAEIQDQDTIEEKLQENIKKVEESFKREKRAMKKKFQTEIQEKDLEIQSLTNKVIRLQNQLKKMNVMQAKSASHGLDEIE